MKILTVLGARPQFIKAISLSSLFPKNSIEEVIVHTGQHFDKEMSENFFSELKLPTPKFNLSVGFFSQTKQTSLIMEKLEEIILTEKPNFLMVYGDTTSTIAGALTASKMSIPIIHIEAGLRSYNKNMPEEINRIVTDHLSTLLFVPTRKSFINLERENIKAGKFLVGDVMYDFINRSSFKINEDFDLQDILNKNRIDDFDYKYNQFNRFYFCTIHRAENTKGESNIRIILDSLNSLNFPVVFPIHPRTFKLVLPFYKNFKNIIFLKPLSYFDNLKIIKNSIMVITDSGGIQKEAFYLKKLCTTLRDETEWIETLEFNNNMLSRINKADIIAKAQRSNKFVFNSKNGLLIQNAAEKILKIIIDWRNNENFRKN